jgi:hypothetical protein
MPYALYPLKNLSLPFVFFLTLLTTSCSQKTSAEDMQQELDTLTSWAATAHMVGEAWASNSVPKTYAQQTLKTTREKLQQEIGTLSKASIPSLQRQTILKSLEQLQATIGQMSTAVAHKDRTALTTQLKQLST